MRHLIGKIEAIIKGHCQLHEQTCTASQCDAPRILTLGVLGEKSWDAPEGEVFYRLLRNPDHREQNMGKVLGWE